MAMRLELFKEILDIESTSGTERGLAEFLAKKFTESDPSCRCVRYEVGDGTLNLLFRWDGGQEETRRKCFSARIWTPCRLISLRKSMRYQPGQCFRTDAQPQLTTRS